MHYNLVKLALTMMLVDSIFLLLFSPHLQYYLFIYSLSYSIYSFIYFSSIYLFTYTIFILIADTKKS